MDKNLFKILQNVIKYTVGIGLDVMIIHIILLLLGINEPFSEWLCGFSIAGFIMLMISSFVLKLCWRFRLALGYDFLVAQCIILQRSFGFFDEILQEARISVLIIGLCINLIIIKNEYFIAKTARKVDN